MIVLTTPTGAIGHKVLEHLVARGEPLRVIARDPKKLPAALREHVEVIEGSHGDPAVVDRAFKGAEALFWLIPPDFGTQDVLATYVAFSKPACAAIQRHGVKRVVAVSALGRGTTHEKHAGLVTAALAMVDDLVRTGAAVRELALPSFMDNILRQVAPIRSAGMFALPIAGDHKVPTCSTSDIAEVAAKLLVDRSWKGFESVPVLGPEDLSFNEMAQIISEALKKPVRFQELSLEAYKAQLIGHGASEAMAQAVIEMMDAKNKGLDNGVQRTAAASSPTSFRQWCSEVLQPAIRAAR